MRKEPAADSVFQRFYPAVVLGVWVLLPEVRRLIDWKIGYNSLSIVSSLPLVSLLPLAIVVSRSKLNELSYTFRVMATLWLCAFGYALLVGWLSSRLVGAVYEGCLFVLPLLFGTWLATMDPALAKRVFARFVSAAIYLSIFVSLYGIYQYVAPPPWDVAWMINSALTSIGNPAPFEVRVFSTLNSPLTCADFLALTLLFTLSRLRRETLWLVAPMLVGVTALILTLVRTSWLEVIAGVAIFACLSPRRSVVLGTSAVVLAVTLLVSMNLVAITGNPQVALAVQDRLSTLNDLSNDGSAEARAYGSQQTFEESLEDPLGQGLGFASGAKLSGNSTATAASTYGTENGYAERLLEMGLFGFALYVGAIAFALVSSFVLFRKAIVSQNENMAMLLAMSVAVQIALIGADVSADHHLSLVAIFYWSLLGLGAALAPKHAAGRVAPDVLRVRAADGRAGAV